MSDRLKFPDEPIRFPAAPIGPEFERELEDSELNDPDERNCTWCAGDGTEECSGSGADDGEDTCVRAHPHLHTCGACRGSGRAKDQWIW